MKKFASVCTGAVLMMGVLAGCASTGASTSEAATKDNPLVLSLAHSLNDSHVTSKALTEFANEVNEKSQGRIQVKIYGNGQLGTELEVMEQLQAGVVDMARVAAPSLATYDEAYHAFGLPYIFDDKEHYYRSMDSDAMRGFFESSTEAGFVTLTYYTSGARSFYTVDKAIREPADLAGLKIRVQNMASQTAMMRALGAPRWSWPSVTSTPVCRPASSTAPSRTRPCSPTPGTVRSPRCSPSTSTP